MATGGGKRTGGKTQIHVSVDEWKVLRAAWEADRSLSFGDIANMTDGRITRQAVTKRAKKEVWTRVDPNAPEVVKAIAKVVADKAAANPIDSGEPEVLPPEGQPDPPGVPSPLAEAVAIEARAAVVDRHRREWGAVRNRLYQGLQQNKFDRLKEAKISAETMSIMQAGERKAWGLDKPLAMTFTFVNESGRDVYD